MTDYFNLTASLARFRARMGGLESPLMALSSRRPADKSFTTRSLLLNDEDYDVLSEALAMASRAANATACDAELLSSRPIAEYLRQWVERFDDLRERIEAR